MGTIPPQSPPLWSVWYNPETEKEYYYNGEKWVECSEEFLDGMLDGSKYEILHEYKNKRGE